jgi:hypothetical protein
MALDNEKLTERPALTNSQDTDIIHVVRGNVSYQKEAQNFNAGSISSLNDVEDVNAPSPQTDNFLKWDTNTNKWIANAIQLGDLLDVVIDDNTLANGQVITYDANEEEWVNTTPSAGATVLNDLNDVNAPSPTDGQALIWDNTSSRWINGEAGASAFLELTDTPADYTCQNGKNVKVGYGLPQPTELVFVPDYFDFACSDEDTDLAVGTVFTMICNRDYPYASAVEFSVTTAPTGSTLTFDVKKNGVTVYTTTPSIDAGEKLTATASTQQVINGNNFSLAIGDELQVGITQVGSTVSGKGLKATMVYNNRVCV